MPVKASGLIQVIHHRQAKLKVELFVGLEELPLP
eukprot:CAMPEP_0171118058 /NCGR_PEP_ID=MMETSP0766_2-20121228/93895_1 /TAXON_ID=439317 /ORGANISM="Gambierdiscus australes, Strain CAWD 149" /LENGTH=33 /DNA_ID= /DNA_START= /DNA_END= /DNA_ORIENTATION=